MIGGWCLRSVSLERSIVYITVLFEKVSDVRGTHGLQRVADEELQDCTIVPIEVFGTGECAAYKIATGTSIMDWNTS